MSCNVIQLGDRDEEEQDVVAVMRAEAQAAPWLDAGTV